MFEFKDLVIRLVFPRTVENVFLYKGHGCRNNLIRAKAWLVTTSRATCLVRVSVDHHEIGESTGLARPALPNTTTTRRRRQPTQQLSSGKGLGNVQPELWVSTANFQERGEADPSQRTTTHDTRNDAHNVRLRLVDKNVSAC